MTTSPASRPAGEAPALPPTAPGQVEIWKKIVDVQQHFNDLELRIRNYALVVTGAFLGLGGYAIKDGGVIAIFGLAVSTAGLVVFCAILPLIAFYFMDRFWYHRLLDGSVQAGIDAEVALKSLGFQVELGTKISASSPLTIWPIGWRVHSKRKMDIFYGILLVTLVIVGMCLGFGAHPEPNATPNFGKPATRNGPLGTSSSPTQEKGLLPKQNRIPALTVP